MIESTPHFIQGVFPLTGAGLDSAAPIAGTEYTVPADKRSQLIYFRAGSSADALVYVVLSCDGKPIRYFPIGAQSSVHVPLAVVEDLFPDSKITVSAAAPSGASGSLVLDIGFVEI